MLNLLTAGTIFGLMTAALLLGRWLAHRLPEKLSDEETRESIRRGAGLLVMLTGLVLGLLVANGKSGFDKVNDMLAGMAARTVQLDHLLVEYGAEATAARAMLRTTVARLLPALWEEQDAVAALAPTRDRDDIGLIDAIQALRPANETETSLRQRATLVLDTLSLDRFHLMILSSARVYPIFLLALIGWLAVLYLTTGFCAARNGLALASDVLTALCVAVAILLILEFDEPFAGLLQASRVPIDLALSTLVLR